MIGLALSTQSASAQAIDWATCGTSPAACSASSTSCCTETAVNLNAGQSGGAKAIVIPLDRCHQAVANSGTMSPPGNGVPDSSGNGWCEDSSPYDSDAMGRAYGLVYRLMQRGVPVYWIVNPTKTATAVADFVAVGSQRYVQTDIDMWIMESGIAAIPTAGNLTNCSGACVPPVSRLNTSTLAAVASSYTKKEFPLRGSVFMIPGADTDGDGTADRTEFNTFWDTYGDGAPGAGRTCAPSNDCYDFTKVSMYEINAGAKLMWKNYITSTTYSNQVPVAVKLNYTPPRIARVKSGGNVSNLFLQAANLDDTSAAGCERGSFSPSDSVVCDLTENDLYNNGLVAGNFGWAWFDGGTNFSSCSRALQSVATFLTAQPGFTTAGNVMVNDSRLSEFEGCTNWQPLGRQGAASAALQFGNVANESNSQPYLIRYPTNLFAQYGDLPMSFASSSVAHWESSTTFGYNSSFTGASNTLKRLLTRERSRVAGTNEVCGDNNADGDVADAGEMPHSKDVFPNNNASGCDADPATAGTNGDYEDLAAYGRYLNSLTNGIVFYLPGNNLSSNGVRGELRMLLNSLIATPNASYTPTPTTSYEVSRATPVVPIIGGSDYIVQGTYVYNLPVGTCSTVNGDADAANFTFPCRVGHMRARLASSTSTILFDAGCNAAAPGALTQFACPAGSAGIPATRTIFTNNAGGDLRNNSAAKVTFDSTLSASMKALISQGAVLSTTSIDTIISRVRAGYPNGSGGYFAILGGVDRSTVAVIQQSGVAGTARPMMAYFGAADGMLHAVCAEVSGPCSAYGQELWAFLPRKMLPYLRTNTARIDGSPRVLDAYIDPDGAGSMTTQWRTVLVFHTSMGDYSASGREPAMYALDITDPSSPRIMWEYSDSMAASAFGTGLTLSAGATTVAGAVKYLVWSDTNNLGTGSPGAVVTAVDLQQGTEYAQAYFAYPNPPRSVSSNDPVVYTGMPAGTVPLDLPSGTTGRVSNIMFTDIYGRLWLLNASTLANVNVNVPLFDVGSNYRAMGNKPAVFSTSGSQYAVFTTGGYVDPSGTTWPLACCASTNGTSCTGTPAYGTPCEFSNGSTQIFPMQKAVAVKLLTTTLTSSISLPSSACDASPTTDPVSGTNLPACTDTNVLFARDLGRDERGASQALVIGTDIFLTTDSSNTNAASYGTSGTNTGHLYAFSSQGGQYGTSAAPSTSIIFGANAAAASNGTGTRYAYAGGAGTFTAGSTSTSGTNVTTNPAASVIRRLWLRVE